MKGWNFATCHKISYSLALLMMIKHRIMMMILIYNVKSE